MITGARCPDAPPTRFVVLTTQRAGSTWLIDTLNSHPSVVAYGELFLQDGRGTPPWGAQDVVRWREHLARLRSGTPGCSRREALVAYLDALFAPRPGAVAIGFKLMYGQAGEYPQIGEYMTARGCSVVHLIRRNVLDVQISREAAVARDLFHVSREEKVAPARVRLDARSLVRQLERLEQEVARARKQLAARDLATVEVCYEDLVSDPGTFGRVLEFLQVPRAGQPLLSRLQKIVKLPHPQTLANYDEVRRVLSGTRFSELLGGNEPPLPRG
ncbi:MAG: Stf0 family sulfotransferase [Candidatus Latescibacterota bacterium]